MLEAADIGSGRSTPGLFPSRRRIRRLRRLSRRWRLAFTRKPPGGEWARLVKHLDCSPKPGGFRVSPAQRAWGYAWFRSSRADLDQMLRRCPEIRNSKSREKRGQQPIFGQDSAPDPVLFVDP